MEKYTIMGGVGRRSRRAMLAAWYGGAGAAAVLSNPELLYAEPPLSTLTGLSYDSRASVLYEVGWRQSDIETGAFYNRDVLNFYVRGIDTRTGQTTFMIVNGTDSKDILYAVTVDEKTSSSFVAGYTRGEFAVGGLGGNSWEIGERKLFYDFLVIAMDANGGMAWIYQDAGRLPSEDWMYSDNLQVNAFRAMAFDEPRGLLHLGGEGAGCLGEGCTLVTESIYQNFVTVALNASTGELVWQRQFIQGTMDYGSATAVAVDEAGGVVFFGGSTSANITQNDMSSDFEDMLIVALEAANGFIVWTRQIGTTNEETVLALAYGNDPGVLYACGYTTGNLTDEFPAQKTSDVVVAAFDATDGETIWLRTFSSDLVDGDDIAYALTYVASGGVGSSGSEHFPDTRRNGLLHISGSTNGKGFDSASGESLVDDSESTNSLNTVFMTMTLDASDGAVISTYQSPDKDNPSAFYASILAPPEVLYLGGIEGRGLSKSGVVYERHHPAPAPSSAPTLASTLPLAQPLTLAPSPSSASAPTSSTSAPTLFLTSVPTVSPTRAPIAPPTSSPVIPPTNAPTLDPTSTVSDGPFSTPNLPPTTSSSALSPTSALTASPTRVPTESPTRAPTIPPAQTPTLDPTSAASDGSTSTPNVSLNPAPFVSPPFAPTLSPTSAPTVSPTSAPTAPSTRAPIASPTRALNIPPSNAPTLGPTSAASDGSTSTPTLSPTFTPTVSSSSAPTASPTPVPSMLPTHAPTLGPTSRVSNDSTSAPSASPTPAPTLSPTSAPTVLPASLPNVSPARAPIAPSLTLPAVSPLPTSSPTVFAPAFTESENTVDPSAASYPISKASQHPVTIAPGNADADDDQGGDAARGGGDGDTGGSLDGGLRLVFVVTGSSISSTFICAVLVAVYRLIVQREGPTAPTTSAE